MEAVGGGGGEKDEAASLVSEGLEFKACRGFPLIHYIKAKTHSTTS